MLDRLVDVFEAPLPAPRRLLGTPHDAALAERVARGTVGFRLRPTRVEAKRKLSQNKPEQVVRSVVAELEGDGPYAQPQLAAEMRRAHPAAARPGRDPDSAGHILRHHRGGDPPACGYRPLGGIPARGGVNFRATLPYPCRILPRLIP